MKITVERVASTVNPTLSTDSCQRSSFPRKNPRRKTKNSVGGVRLKRESVAPSGRRGTRPETPFLGWKTDQGICRDDDSVEEKSAAPAADSGRRRKTIVSARKLAADIWRMRSPEIQTGGSYCGSNTRCNGGNKVQHCSQVTDLVNSPHSVSGPKHSLLYKGVNSAMEGATKWDPDGWKVSNGMKLIKNPVDHHHQSSAASAVVSALEVELDQAKARIHELESERRSSKKKLEQFLQKLSDEKTAWRTREHNKVRAIIEDMKADLTREKKNRQRLEMINSKLVNELADLKVSAKRYLQEYEKERKARELIEEVCDELAKEIGEDKAEVEALKRDSINAREEVEEERKMLQMAEVWREERVQMKLVDAKVMLEEKYSQMNKLIADLESFLRSTAHMVDSGENKKAQFLRQVAASVSMQDIRDLKYEPPNPDEMLSVFEDVNNGESHDRQGEEVPSIGYSPVSHTSKIHAASPEVKKLNRDTAQRRHSSGYIDHQNGVIEDDTSEWETVSQPEDQGSMYSVYGSDPSVGKDTRFCYGGSRSKAEWDKNGDGEETQIMEINEVDPAKMRQSKKGLLVSKLWKSCPINGDNYKIISVDGRVSNGRLSNGELLTTDNDSAKGGFSPNDVTGKWSSPESGNPHINRAKGCIEWPRSIQKSSLKARLMEARMENQKVQLRQVLKHKI